MLKEKTIRRVFSHPPVLATDRLVLRQLKPGDAGDMFLYASRRDVTEFLTWEAHPSEEYTRDFLVFVQDKYKEGEYYDWAVILKDERGREGTMIGTCGFTSFDFPNNSAEIGYVINPAYRNRGYATEAVNRVLRFAFEELELNRVQARYIIGNDVSRRVMDKSGFRFEGVCRAGLLHRGKYRDVGVCSVLAGEWFRKNGAVI